MGSVAVDTHLVGFGVPPTSPLRKGVLAIWAGVLAGVLAILQVCLQSGHIASFVWSTWGGIAVGLIGGFLWRWNDDTADRVDDGRALRAISLFSTRRDHVVDWFLEDVGRP